MSHPRPTRPALHTRQGGVLSLPGPALIELLRAVTATGKPFRFRARGRSMSPFIREGDVITIAPCSATSVKLGQVVAFVNPSTGMLTVHRVVGIRRDACLMQGDNEGYPDGWVPRTCILGQVTRLERNGRPVRLGMGPERIWIALLHRVGWLRPLVRQARYLLRPKLRLRRDADDHKYV